MLFGNGGEPLMWSTEPTGVRTDIGSGRWTRASARYAGLLVTFQKGLSRFVPRSQHDFEFADKASRSQAPRGSEPRTSPPTSKEFFE